MSRADPSAGAADPLVFEKERDAHGVRHGAREALLEDALARGWAT